MFRNLMFYLIFLFLFFPLAFAEEKQDLILPDVIVKSSFREKPVFPKIPHNFDLIFPIGLREPYQPTIESDGIRLPDELPQNIEISWLANSFLSFLSGLFYGDNGTLQQAVLDWREGNADSAAKRLSEISEAKGIDGAEALLWLGWIRFRQNRYKESLATLKRIDKEISPRIARESAYLEALILYKKYKYDTVIAKIEQIMQAQTQKIGFKLTFLHALTLGKLNRWEKAGQIIDQLVQNFPFAANYSDLLSFAAIVNYHLDNLEKSKEQYDKAIQISPNKIDIAETLRHSAWVHYLNGEYEQARSLSSKLAPLSSLLTKSHQDEVDYLNLMINIRTQKWKAAKHCFIKISPTSLMKEFAAYQIFNLGKGQPELQSFMEEIPQKSFLTQDFGTFIAFAKANEYFISGNYNQAEAFYLRSISVNPETNQFDKIQYNLGLTYMKNKAFEKACSIFSKLDESSLPEKGENIRYHFGYCLYKWNKFQQLLQLFNQGKLKQNNIQRAAEMEQIAARAYLHSKKFQPAIQLFLSAWEKTKKIGDLELAIAASYQANQFDKVIELTLKIKNRSPLINRLAIKSFLALQKFKAALQILNTLNYNKPEWIALALEVWKANQLHETIKQQTPFFLRTPLPHHLRLLCYLSMADAYFNLQEYQSSKNELFKALKISKDESQKSLIRYNLILSTYLDKDYAGFLRETNKVLKEKLIPDTRYNIILLLSNYYIEQNNFSQADRILRGYLKQHRYLAAKVHYKRIKIQYDKGDFNKCLSLASTPSARENRFERRDRIIQAGVCAIKTENPNKALPLMKAELEVKNNYRKPELTLTLAKAFFQNKKFKPALKLLKQISQMTPPESVKQETRFYQASIYSKTKQEKMAEELLGDVNDFREIKKYYSALQIQAELQSKRKNYEGALRSLLRLYYHPKTQKNKKSEILLQASDYYLKLKKKHEANLLFTKIDPKYFSNDKKKMTKYREIKKQL